MKQYRVTVESLNIRSGPGTSYEVVGGASQDEILTEPDISGWVPVVMEDNTIGWCSAKYLMAYEAPPEPETEGTPWMAIAAKYIGVHEIAGEKDDPQIVKWAQTCTLKATDDETPWCSEFVNGVFVEAGYKGTNDARAVSWLDWGVELEEPRYGCVVVFEWSSGSHHVGFYVDDDGSRVKVLGGNQSDAVNETWFDMGAVMGYRWPA